MKVEFICIALFVMATTSESSHPSWDRLNCITNLTCSTDENITTKCQTDNGSYNAL